MSMLKGEVNNHITFESWYNFCRDICSKYLLQNPIILGGKGKIVQIDETKFGSKRKYNRGRNYHGIDSWVFGIVEEGSDEVLMWIVSDRKRETLQPLIEKHIVKGSVIHSDTWSPYFNLSSLGYVHKMVNHSKEYVTDEGVHTNKIESQWNVVKSEFKKMRGMNSSQFPIFLDEHMYRRKFKNEEDFFMMFLQHIAFFYNTKE